MDSIPTASACIELPLPSHPPYDVAKCTPYAVDRTQPELILCMCFTEPSETAIKYTSVSWALSTSTTEITVGIIDG